MNWKQNVHAHFINKQKTKKKKHSKSKLKKNQTKIASSGILLHLGKSRAHRNQPTKQNLKHLFFIFCSFHSLILLLVLSMNICCNYSIAKIRLYISRNAKRKLSRWFNYDLYQQRDFISKRVCDRKKMVCFWNVHHRNSLKRLNQRPLSFYRLITSQNWKLKMNLIKIKSFRSSFLYSNSIYFPSSFPDCVQ